MKFEKREGVGATIFSGYREGEWLLSAGRVGESGSSRRTFSVTQLWGFSWGDESVQQKTADTLLHNRTSAED